MTNYTRGNGLLEQFLAKKRVKMANKLISKFAIRGKVLDIGCGIYPYFLKVSDFEEKYGVDPNINLNIINDKDLFLKKINIEKIKLPFSNNFFDVVTMLAVFEHINDDKLKHVLEEIFRVLKKDGVLIITTPAPWANIVLHFMSRMRLISREEIEDHKHNHSNVKINFLLERNGFEKKNIKNGFFELGMNMWFCAKK